MPQIRSNDIKLQTVQQCLLKSLVPLEQSDTLPDTDTLLEKIRQLYSEDTVIHHQEKEPLNVVIKNDKENEDKCVKCRRKVLNGIRCTICKKAWHWKCGGVTKESTTRHLARHRYALGKNSSVVQ